MVPPQNMNHQMPPSFLDFLNIQTLKFALVELVYMLMFHLAVIFTISYLPYSFNLNGLRLNLTWVTTCF